jgi:protein-L-isoaspartate(D-aspartate) O-methyltransferase
MSDLNIESARFNMVEQQIRTWDVLDDRVLDAIRATPREDFVPSRYRNLAFADLQLPLPHDQAMMAPRLEARILQTVDPKPAEQVLEIGTGTGYFATLLSRLSAHVTSVDCFAEFRTLAEDHLKAHQIRNITLETGDAAKGWDDGRRYDVVVVTGSLPELHHGFHRSLTMGGRLFLIVGKPPVMSGLLITRVGENQWATESLLETCVKPLINAPETRTFTV